MSAGMKRAYHQATKEALDREAEERSARLDDPCRHLTRCADAACKYRMDAARG